VFLITVQSTLLIFMTLDLQERLGLTIKASASLLFIALCAGAVGRILLAAWSDRSTVGRSFPVKVSMYALMLGLLVFALVDRRSFAELVCLAVWLGFFGFGWYGPWVASVADVAPPERVGFALGLAMALNQIAIIASPPLFGTLRDHSGGYVSAWLVLIVMLLLAVCLTSKR
jgi:MFS family permease